MNKLTCTEVGSETNNQEELNPSLIKFRFTIIKSSETSQKITYGLSLVENCKKEKITDIGMEEVCVFLRMLKILVTLFESLWLCH